MQSYRYFKGRTIPKNKDFLSVLYLKMISQYIVDKRFIYRGWVVLNKYSEFNIYITGNKLFRRGFNVVGTV